MTRRRHSAGKTCRTFRKKRLERRRRWSGRSHRRRNRRRRCDRVLNWRRGYDGCLSLWLRFRSVGRGVSTEGYRTNDSHRAENEQNRRERAAAQHYSAAALLGDHPRFVPAVQADLRAWALLVRTGFEGR